MANLSDTIYKIAGPLIYILAAYVLYARYEKKYLKNVDNTEKKVG